MQQLRKIDFFESKPLNSCCGLVSSNAPCCSSSSEDESNRPIVCAAVSPWNPPNLLLLGLRCGHLSRVILDYQMPNNSATENILLKRSPCSIKDESGTPEAIQSLSPSSRATDRSGGTDRTGHLWNNLENNSYPIRREQQFMVPHQPLSDPTLSVSGTSLFGTFTGRLHFLAYAEAPKTPESIAGPLGVLVAVGYDSVVPAEDVIPAVPWSSSLSSSGSFKPVQESVEVNRVDWRCRAYAFRQSDGAFVNLVPAAAPSSGDHRTTPFEVTESTPGMSLIPRIDLPIGAPSLVGKQPSDCDWNRDSTRGIRNRAMPTAAAINNRATMIAVGYSNDTVALYDSDSFLLGKNSKRAPRRRVIKVPPGVRPQTNNNIASEPAHTNQLLQQDRPDAFGVTNLVFSKSTSLGCETLFVSTQEVLLCLQVSNCTPDAEADACEQNLQPPTPGILWQDSTAGCMRGCCGCATRSSPDLFSVLRPEGLYTYQAEQGNLTVLPLDGVQRNTTCFCFRNYEVLCIATGNSQQQPGSSRFHCLYDDSSHASKRGYRPGALIAPTRAKNGYSCGEPGNFASEHFSPGDCQSTSFTLAITLNFMSRLLVFHTPSILDITHLVNLNDTSILVICQRRTQPFLQIIEIREMPGLARIGALVERQLFEWAIRLAEKEPIPPASLLPQLSMLYGDWLFDRGNRLEAAKTYCDTIGFFEPCHIITKFISHYCLRELVVYLKALHLKRRASSTHLALLLKCFCSAKESTVTEEEFRNSLTDLLDELAEPESSESVATNLDWEVAVEECRSAGDAISAEMIARRFALHETLVSIYLEDFEGDNGLRAIKFLKNEAPLKAQCNTLLNPAIGSVLLRQQPRETMDLLRLLLNNRSITLEACLPIFVDLPPSAPNPDEEPKAEEAVRAESVTSNGPCDEANLSHQFRGLDLLKIHPESNNRPMEHLFLDLAVDWLDKVTTDPDAFEPLPPSLVTTVLEMLMRQHQFGRSCSHRTEHLGLSTDLARLDRQIENVIRHHVKSPGLLFTAFCLSRLFSHHNGTLLVAERVCAEVWNSPAVSRCTTSKPAGATSPAGQSSCHVKSTSSPLGIEANPAGLPPATLARLWTSAVVFAPFFLFNSAQESDALARYATRVCCQEPGVWPLALAALSRYPHMSNVRIEKLLSTLIVQSEQFASVELASRGTISVMSRGRLPYEFFGSQLTRLGCFIRNQSMPTSITVLQLLCHASSTGPTDSREVSLHQKNLAPTAEKAAAEAELASTSEQDSATHRTIKYSTVAPHDNSAVPRASAADISAPTPHLHLGNIKAFLISRASRLKDKRDEALRCFREDFKDTQRLRASLRNMQSQLQVFSIFHKMCDSCNQQLDLPIVQFTCGHVYHQYCSSPSTAQFRVHAPTDLPQVAKDERPSEARRAARTRDPRTSSHHAGSLHLQCTICSPQLENKQNFLENRVGQLKNIDANGIFDDLEGHGEAGESEHSTALHATAKFFGRDIFGTLLADSFDGPGA